MKQVTLCVIFLSSVEKYHAHIVEVEILSLFVKFGLDFHMHDWYIFYTKYLQHVNLFIFIECILTQILLGRKSFYFNPHFLFLRFYISLEFISNYLSSRWSKIMTEIKIEFISKCTLIASIFWRTDLFNFVLTLSCWLICIFLPADN